MSNSKKTMEYSFKNYLKEMARLKEQEYEDETSMDVMNLYTLKVLIDEYEEKGKINLVNPHRTLKEELMIYFGDVERTEIVLSYFAIAKDLIDNGATFNI
ncbi:hypothetical protein [Clostridium sp. Cult2]|uniref:hypothetical protein n=1 Tax=Clostridium sp. Cult2 TaxID=2079003 RepID=UPI001F1F6C7F|nr:hypothetical protein [Clostridium sp. Cult2]MCF6464618.1 hypothetical protein [Clostridium sp. Cult2]